MMVHCQIYTTMQYVLAVFLSETPGSVRLWDLYTNSRNPAKHVFIVGREFC